MTKDEAIEVLREALKRLTQECELDGLDDIAGYDCWLPEAKKALAATAAIEDDRNAASPAAPAGQRDAAAPARHAIHNLKQYRLGGDMFPGEAIGILERFIDEHSEPSKTAGAAKGGITSEEKHCPDCDGIRDQSCYCEPKAAQPAADPAPAQTGIDHACTLTDAELADPEYVRAYIEGCNESFAAVTAELKTHRGMADCMDMVRGELVEAGIIDKTVPPMFIADAVLNKISALDGEARRYRFLRANAYIEIRGNFQRIDGWQPGMLDQSIDAALAGRTPGEAG